MNSRKLTARGLATWLALLASGVVHAQASFHGIGQLPPSQCTTYAPTIPADSFQVVGAFVITATDPTGQVTVQPAVTQAYAQAVPDPIGQAVAMGLDATSLTQACNGTFSAGSATQDIPATGVGGPGIDYAFHNTAVASNGVVTITQHGTSTTCVPWAPGGTCLTFSADLLVVTTYNVATGALSTSLTARYDDTSTDGVNQYATTYSGSGSYSAVLPVTPSTLASGVFSEVRDATFVNGNILAVGGSARNPGSIASDTAVQWTLAGGLVALPDLVQNNVATNAETASQVTRDGSTIASRARSSGGNAREAVLVTNGGTTNTPLGYLPGVTGVAQYSAATALSEDATVVYGFGRYDSSAEPQAFRWTAAQGMQALGFASAGDVASLPTARAVSADGSVMLGNGGTDTTGTVLGAGNRAFRYAYGAGMTPLPLLPGGVGNMALALTPDGATGLGAGDSTAYPNGELLLWDLANGTAQGLGSPDGTLSPGNFGGLTADGQVAGTWFDTATGSAGSYIHNAHGWFPLATVLGSAGADLGGWTLDVMLGVSPDGTLLFGRGSHNGNQEGWVASVPAGFLRDYGADRTPPVITPLVTGTPGANGWYRSNVTLTWSVTDPESAVTAQQGCGTATVGSDTAGITFTCTATSAGGTSTQSITLKRDASPPVAFLLSPLQNFTVCFQFFGQHCYQSPAVYPRGSQLVARYYCADNGPSGLATCTGTLPNGARIGTSTPGTYSFVVTATDNAGNTRSVQSVYQVN